VQIVVTAYRPIGKVGTIARQAFSFSRFSLSGCWQERGQCGVAQKSSKRVSQAVE
jgi:hypothetical protein